MVEMARQVEAGECPSTPWHQANAVSAYRDLELIEELIRALIAENEG